MQQPFYRWALILLVLAATQSFADESSDDPLPEEDTFIGTWYMQIMDGELMPLKEQMRMVFNEDGTVKLYRGEEEDESGRYTHDKNRATIKIYDEEDPGDIELILKYSFVDDMFVVRYREDPGQDDDDEGVIEFTRNKEGAERHQKLRDQKEAEPKEKNPERLLNQAKRIVVAVTSAAVDEENGLYPAHVGEAVLSYGLEVADLLPPSTRPQVPKDFEKWERAKKMQWIDRHSGYVYLAGGSSLDDAHGDHIAVFQSRMRAGSKTVAVACCDGSAKMMAVADADKLIKLQTGHSLAEWRKSTSPGTGKMVLPEKKKDGRADSKDQDK